MTSITDMNANNFLLLLTFVFTMSGCGISGPTNHELEQAIQTEMRSSYAMRLQQLSEMNPLASLAGTTQTNSPAAAAERLVVHLVDKSCTEIGKNRFECDALVAIGDTARASEKPEQAQTKYELVKLDKEWRASRKIAGF